MLVDSARLITVFDSSEGARASEHQPIDPSTDPLSSEGEKEPLYMAYTPPLLCMKVTRSLEALQTNLAGMSE